MNVVIKKIKMVQTLSKIILSPIATRLKKASSGFSVS